MLEVGLVGCGRIAKRHAELLGLGQINGARLAAVCDLNAERLGLFTNEYDVPGYLEMEEMADNGRVNLLSVLTPSGMHAEHVIRLARFGLPLVVEKPMALRLEDADAMLEACDRYGSRLFVVKQNRFNLPVIKLREALDAGRFGRLVMGTARVRWRRTQDYYDQDDWRGTWALDGGVLANQASHHIDMLSWMLGEVDSVYATGMTALADIEAEDTAAVILKFRNGALGIIEATTATRPDNLEGSISLLGEGGTVVIGGFAVNEIQEWRFVDALPSDEVVKRDYSVNPPDVYGFGHKAYYEHVVSCIESGCQQLVDGLVGRRNIELLNAIYESMASGREVRLRFRPVLSHLGKNQQP
ncbi:Gfo/Idh/MocA family oxidoreductase [Magnetovirga frankeli]|uniref:Gfo/Idh/MocA family protein n=1 Tax=Magnetovirga frankeli TaxID=947516 RepID=UPI001293A146|nr:Gfo/Idh/MocA family oxidoreductase [gamma proteobacterium SS-5]